MPSAPTQRVTVLVADDDPVMRMLMLEMLAQVGLDGIQAGDGIEALYQARTGQPDLILMDVDMPPNAMASACRSSW
jgi:CheY-like chemotaxis protein